MLSLYMFSRQKYDRCSENSFLKRSRDGFDYRMRPPIQDNPCLPDTPLIIVQRGGDSISGGPRVPFSGPIDADTDLRGVNRKAGHCPQRQYMPRCSNCGSMNSELIAAGGFCDQCQSPLGLGYSTNFGECNFPVEVTRSSNPAGNLRDVEFDYWAEPLCCGNPQDRGIFFPGRFMVNSRMEAKEAFRPCAPSPRVNSMNPQ